jgi:hypothetical protein
MKLTNLSTKLSTLAIVLVLGSAAPGRAGGELKPGWTAEVLATETVDCTKSLVQGAWANTKREQGADPNLPLTDEILKELEPQIASMKKLCACAVRAAAERYTKAEADKAPADLDRFVADTIAKGTCKLSP